MRLKSFGKRYSPNNKKADVVVKILSKLKPSMNISQTKRYAESLLLGILVLAPIFSLTVRGWTTLTLVLAAALSLTLLLLDRNSDSIHNQIKKQQETTDKSNANFWVWLMVITLTSPVFAVLISQSLRHDWV